MEGVTSITLVKEGDGKKKLILGAEFTKGKKGTNLKGKGRSIKNYIT
jgi:hypothetical protein